MIRTTVQIEDLGIEIYQDRDRIGIRAHGADVMFPKNRSQDIVNAVLIVDWAINRQVISKAAHEDAAKKVQ